MSSIREHIERQHGIGTPRASRIDHKLAFVDSDPIVSPGEKGRVNWIDRQHEIAENDFLETLQDVGRMITPAEYADRDKKISQTVQMTQDLADRVEKLGIKVYGDGDPIQIISAHSGIIKELPNFRQVNWLPMSAAKKRNPMLNMLLYYTQTRGMKNFRHVVLHKGPRCLIEDIPERYRDMKKGFNRWNKHYAARWGAYFVFYSCEAGSPVKKASEKVKGTRPYILSSAGKRIRQTDHEGRQTWHPHIHALLEMESFIPLEDFEAMTDDLRHCFGDLEYLFNEPLENTRELCKYMVKCDELFNCKDADLLAYIETVQGLKTVQSMGGFMQFKKAMKDAGRVIRNRTDYKTGKAELVPMKNWNRDFAGDVQDRTDGERLEKNIRDTLTDDSGPLMKPALISRMSPTNLFSPVAEPCFMVRGRCNDLKEFLSRRKIALVVEQTRSDFLAGWQDFRNEYGVSFEMWQSQGEIAALAAAKQPETTAEAVDLDGFFVEPDPESLVSAHNTSTTGRNLETHPPFLQPPEANGELGKRLAPHPKGCEAATSTQSSQLERVEPHREANWNHETLKDGSLRLVTASDTEPIDDYF